MVEVRVNGRDWSGLANPAPGIPALRCSRSTAIRSEFGCRATQGMCSAGSSSSLKGCEPIRLGPGRHRIETLPGLSGAVLTTSLVPLGERRASAPNRPPGGKVELVDRSPTQLDLRVKAPKGALLMGGMPWHRWLGRRWR